MAPVPGGPLIDAGVANGLATDQRSRPRTAAQGTADGTGSDGTDIGAVELEDGDLIGFVATAKKKQKVKRKVRIVVEAGAGEAATAGATGTVKLGGKRFPLGDVTGSIPAGGGTTTLMLKPQAKKAARKLARGLKKGKKAKAQVRVTVADGFAHSSTATLPVTLQGKKKKKRK